MRDIHQQVLLLESFNHRGEHDRYEFHCGRCYRLLGDEDSGMEVVFGNVVGERFHLFDADWARFRREFDPDRADCSRWVWHRAGGEGGVFFEHGRGRARGESHFFATEWVFRRGGGAIMLEIQEDKKF